MGMPNQLKEVSEQIRAAVRTGQIITFALFQGVVTMAGIFIYLGVQAPKEPPNQLFLALGIAIATSATALSFVVPWVMHRAMIHQFRTSLNDSDGASTNQFASAVKSLVTRYNALTIISQAIPEGAAMANVIFFFLGRSWWHLPIAALLALLILARLPRVSQVQSIIEEAMDA